MDAPSPADPARARAAGAHERLPGFIYGTLVVLTMIVVGAKAYPDEPGVVAALVVVTAAVLWLAHVYAHGVALSVSEKKRLSLADMRHLARARLRTRRRAARIGGDAPLARRRASPPPA